MGYIYRPLLCEKLQNYTQHSFKLHTTQILQDNIQNHEGDDREKGKKRSRKFGVENENDVE